ncbi:2',3'-cyclic-nucleotide 3'-phosphodiesterase-like [Panulirus ornatus]|uniref:2',3'-cyclic-nucleotide 3'-phosphodiesterase-like n=1 Tax=Panulirus ornatus TaxID=150431 RepID=UPI003A85BF2F
MGKIFSRVWQCCKGEESLSDPPSDAEECLPISEPATSSVSHSPVSEQYPQEVNESPSCIKQVTPSDATPLFLQSKLLKDHEAFLNYPILQDKKTMEYVQKSKVMVIMKGLSGSGKSHIVRRIQKIYKDAVVCSADSYFMKDGIYQFKREELKDAHKSCQQKAQNAAQRGCHIIVIDNTNVQAWESKYYLKLTKEYNYTPLILEPQTPWAMDPKELAERNSHGVSEDILAKKLKDYQPVLPLYYWWFLNEADSKKVSMMVQEWLRRALQVRRFFQDFTDSTNLTSDEEILDYYSKNTEFGGYKVLHATAKVSKRGKAPNAMEYIDSPLVRKSIGKCFSLHIIGYVITPRTFGARLKLGESELELWDMNDNETETEETTRLTTSSNTEKLSTCVKESSNVVETESDNNIDCKKKGKLQMLECHPTVSIISPELKNDRFFPTSGKGSRAHLTLGCAPNVHARTTGFDLINVISCEQRVKEIEKSGDTESCKNKVETYSITEGVLKTYGKGIWVIYPEQEMVVSSLFSAFY